MLSAKCRVGYSPPTPLSRGGGLKPTLQKSATYHWDIAL
jgi:hypothetical protein